MSAAETRQKTVVVVEDTAVVRALLVAFLKPYGCRIIEATNGAEGITAIRAASPDLVLLDISMPEISGNDVLRLMRADAGTRNIPVIMTTAQAAKEMVAEVVSHGVSAYLVKPITREVFDRAVGKILESSTAAERRAGDGKPSDGAAKVEAKREAVAPGPPKQASMALPIVLVADESGRTLDAVRDALDGQARVVSATNGPEAVARFEEERPAVSLLSLRLPGLDGWDTIAAIRALGVDGGRFLALLPQGEAVEQTRLEEAGFSGRLAKPLPEHDLVHTVLAAAAAAGDAANAKVEWVDGVPVVIFPVPALPAFARIVLGLPRVVQRLAGAGHDSVILDLGDLEDASGIPRLVARMLAAATQGRMRAAAVASPAVAAALEAIAETNVPYLRTRADAIALLAAKGGRPQSSPPPA
jgi:CheY-like chemotaxis protein